MAQVQSVESHWLAAVAELFATRIGVEEALDWLHRGRPFVFVDARREAEWRRATDKLPGAVRLAPDRPDETLPVILAGRTAITYCTCPGEASSVTVADVLRTRGQQHVCVLDGGLDAWRLAGGPTEPI